MPKVSLQKNRLSAATKVAAESWKITTENIQQRLFGRCVVVGESLVADSSVATKNVAAKNPFSVATFLSPKIIKVATESWVAAENR